MRTKPNPTLHEIYGNDDRDLGTYTGGSIDREFGSVLWGLFVAVAIIGGLLWWSWGGDREGMAWDRVESIPGASNIEMIQHSRCYSLLTEGNTNDLFEFHYDRNNTSHSVYYCCSPVRCDVRR